MENCRVCWLELRSRYTSGRTPINPLGNVGYHYVMQGNVLLSRVIIIILICSAKKVRWLLEQPSGSCVSDHPRWQWLLQRVRASCLCSMLYSWQASLQLLGACVHGSTN